MKRFMHSGSVTGINITKKLTTLLDWKGAGIVHKQTLQKTFIIKETRNVEDLGK